MRLVSPGPEQASVRSEASSTAGSRRRLAPTPVGQVTRDERFVAKPQPSAVAQKAPQRKIAPTPVSAPQSQMRSLSKAPSFASVASQSWQVPTPGSMGSPDPAAATCSSATATYASATSASAASPWPLSSSNGSRAASVSGVTGRSQPSQGNGPAATAEHSKPKPVWDAPAASPGNTHYPSLCSDAPKSAAQSQTKQDALARRLAGPEVSPATPLETRTAPGRFDSVSAAAAGAGTPQWHALQTRSPSTPPPPSDAATWGSSRRNGASASGSDAWPAAVRATPLTMQSSADSNHLAASMPYR